MICGFCFCYFITKYNVFCLEKDYQFNFSIPLQIQMDLLPYNYYVKQELLVVIVISRSKNNLPADFHSSRNFRTFIEGGTTAFILLFPWMLPVPFHHILFFRWKPIWLSFEAFFQHIEMRYPSNISEEKFFYSFYIIVVKITFLIKAL